MERPAGEGLPATGVGLPAGEGLPATGAGLPAEVGLLAVERPATVVGEGPLPVWVGLQQDGEAPPAWGWASCPSACSTPQFVWAPLPAHASPAQPDCSERTEEETGRVELLMSDHLNHERPP